MLLSLLVIIIFLAIRVKWAPLYRPKGKGANHPFERRAPTTPPAY